MRVAIAAFVMLACAASLCGADDRTPGHDFLWLQGPDVEAVAWSSNVSLSGGWYSQIATDFIATETTEVNHIHWWGQRSDFSRGERPTVSVRTADWNRDGDRALDCGGAFRTGCNVVLTGDNTGGPTNVDYYNCSAWLEDGPEVVYELMIPFDETNITVTIGDLSADLDIFLLSACNENTCITVGNNYLSATLPAGTYYLVVDGYHGAVSSYTLTIECLDYPPLYFTIRFYDHSVDERGALLYELIVGDAHETPVGRPYVLYSYWADIPPFPVVTGHHYWISIQGAIDTSELGQWFWQQAEFSALEWPVWDSDIFGFPRWTPFPDAVGETVDIAFGLASVDTPVEARSWGVIKSLYR
jgi:hypothetical protein